MSERLKILLGALGGAILTLLLVGSLSGGGMGHSKMGGLFSPLFVLLFWALVVTLVAVLVVWIVTQVQRR